MDWRSATTKDDGTISVPERWLHLHYYEALNILFRMENSLRVFVYGVLKNKFQKNWAQTNLQTVDEEKYDDRRGRCEKNSASERLRLFGLRD